MFEHVKKVEAKKWFRCYLQELLWTNGANWNITKWFNVVCAFCSNCEWYSLTPTYVCVYGGRQKEWVCNTKIWSDIDNNSDDLILTQICEGVSLNMEQSFSSLKIVIPHAILIRLKQMWKHIQWFKYFMVATQFAISWKLLITVSVSARYLTNQHIFWCLWIFSV